MKLLFPTVIHEIPVKNFETIKLKLADFIQEEFNKDPEGVEYSNVGGWQSQPYYMDFDNILLSTVSETLLSYFKNNNVLNMNKEITYKGLWMNVNKDGDYITTHDHPNCDMAGVFWINVPDGSGYFECQSPHSYDYGAESTIYTDDFKEKTNFYGSYSFKAIAGSIILFPAALNHRVTPSHCMDPRISASFNLTFNV